MISIIVPVYNAQKYIKETIDNVLQQTYSDFELILVDDGSTDDSRTIIESVQDPRVHLYRNDKKGAYSARNYGVDRAAGRYIAFLDADDKWDSQKLEKTLKFMENKNAAFVFTSYEFGNEQCVPTGKIVKVPETLKYKEALGRTIIFTSTVMFDTEKMDKQLIHMPHIESEDTATWWNILRTGIVAYGLNESLVIYRRSSNTLSSNKIVALRRIWNLYRKNEHMNVFQSAFYFVGWAFRAVARRI